MYLVNLLTLEDVVFYPVIGIALAIVLCLLARNGRWNRWRRRRNGACLQCGYDLRHDFDKGCPECGWRRV